MKKPYLILSFISLTAFLLLSGSCASTSKSKVIELENKGTVIGTQTPNWVQLYLAQGVSALYGLPEFKNKYCIVGEESGVNRQFVLAWADSASAQQRIASFVQTNIASRYEAAITATAQEQSSRYGQEIDNVLNAVVNVSFSGAQREADWWSLRRRYDPKEKTVFTDEYTAWVLYTIPRGEMNRQIALAMETSVSKDSILYDITIALARDILLQGYDTNEIQSAASIQQTASVNYDPPGSIVAQGIDDINLIDEYVVGRDVAASILSTYKIYDTEPILTDYLNKILAALVISSPKPGSFDGHFAAVLDSDTINAMASPGGHIFVTRGLIAAAKSEDALAAVIAHELAHIQLRHGMRAIRSNRDTEDWVRQFMFGTQTIADRINAGFSQTQEFDADIAALSLLVETGYNPQGLIDILLELEKVQGGIRGGFSTTHPSPTSRLVNAKVAVARYSNIPNNSRFRQSRFDSVIR